MKNFTINDLERFSGIKAHTLRMWERRYALVHPGRSSGNCRLYTIDEVKKILNIALLKKNGYKISILAKASTESIEEKIDQLSNDYIKWQKAINDLTINMYTSEPGSFESILDGLLIQWPIDTLIEKIIFPFLNITGLLWTGKKLNEEHLVVTAIRKKLIFAIESCDSITNRDNTVLLFLPDNKQLDLGLLYANYFLKRKGIHVLYLGSDVTISNLKSIFQVQPPSYVFTYLLPNHQLLPEQLLTCLDIYAPDAKLIIAEYGFNPISPIFKENQVRLNYIAALKFITKYFNS
jgi:DNA-binding transcriptional MerR regulator